MEQGESNTNLFRGPYRVAIRADSEDAEDERRAMLGRPDWAQANRRIVTW